MIACLDVVSCFIILFPNHSIDELVRKETMRGFATRAVATLLSLSLAPGRAVGDAPPQVPLANGLPEPRNKGHPLNSVFKEYIDQIREDLHVPGLSIGVVDGDETYLAVIYQEYTKTHAFHWGILALS